MKTMWDVKHDDFLRHMQNADRRREQERPHPNAGTHHRLVSE